MRFIKKKLIVSTESTRKMREMLIDALANWSQLDIKKEDGELYCTISFAKWPKVGEGEPLVITDLQIKYRETTIEEL